jgi:hypothetical protein
MPSIECPISILINSKEQRAMHTLGFRLCILKKNQSVVTFFSFDSID